MVLFGGKKRRVIEKHLRGTSRKSIALLLAALMLCSMLPATVFALGNTPEYLCGHVHDANCGYIEGSEGTPCTHAHDANCGYIEGSPCSDVHTHDASCGYIEAVVCNHVHDASCGYSEPVLAAPCSHICEILSFSDFTPGEAVGTYEAESVETYDDVCAALPETLPGLLACAGDEVDIPLRWSCADYSAEPGTYTFRAELENEHCAYATIDNELTEDVDESELPFITVTVPEAAAPVPTTAPPNNIYTISDDTNTVSVTGLMPEGARLEVRALTEEELAIYVAEDVNVVFAYDIKIMIPNGEGEAEYQPTSETPVTVTITQPEPIAAPTVEVVHIAEDAETGEPTQQPVATVTPAENTIKFEAEGFSIYIGTTQPTLIDVSELYYNGSGFFTDADCTAGNQVKDASGVAFTDMQTLINNVVGDLTIYMTATYTVNGTQSITGGTVYNVTLKRHSSYTAIPLIAVPSGGDLTLSNITIDGGAVWNNEDPATRANIGIVATAAAVSVDGSLTLNSGAVVQNNNNTTSNATGGGVYVHSGTFTMNGGEVSGNKATSKGGGVYANSSTFNMNGGEVSGNTATNYGGGVYITASSQFTMSSGMINGNTASNGGGVYITVSSQFTMSSGMINGNTVSNGGGVYICATSTVTMSDGSISGNTAIGNGGGVFVDGGALTMIGGTVSGNKASYCGGVYVYSGTFNMNGGEVSGNTATSMGGGVYVNTNGAVNMSGSPSLADEVYLQQGNSITVNAAFTPTAPVPVAGEGFTLGRTVATYEAGLTPDAAKFSLSDAAHSLTASGQDIVIIQSPPQGTVTAAGEGVALGAGQSKTYTLPLAEHFATNANISITNVTSTEGLTHEAYNTVYQNRRNYGYIKANSTFGLSVTKTGGTETDSYATNYSGGISLGTVAAGDALTFTVYNANAITNPNPAGSLTVTLSDGSSVVDVVISINRRSDVQLNVTVPIQITASMDAAGTFTFPNGDDYAIVNNSNVPIEITSMSWAWAEDNASLFLDNTKLSASISLGASETPYSFTNTDLTCTPGEDGSIIAYNGIVPGRLPLHWGLELGAGNALKSYPGNGVSVQIATVTYTINVAEGEFTSG